MVISGNFCGECPLRLKGCIAHLDEETKPINYRC
jgi:hypothetical protein